ncbi:MAG: HD domain-containing protein [Myxococcales bacterium]|nr:HD domain-containing protein [Myxococcales bacterium]
MALSDDQGRHLASLTERHRAVLGPDVDAYLGHVRRVLAFHEMLAGEPPSDGVLVAAFFHDLGIWTEGTNDYLAPSAAAARDYLAELAGEADVETIVAMIEWHHKLLPFKGPIEGIDGEAVERFRKADLVDFSWGLYSAGLPRARVREVFRAEPPGSFRRWLVGLIGGWLLHNPTRPFPVVRL